jgi:transcriptional regulator with XRE-family HTH domain
MSCDVITMDKPLPQRTLGKRILAARLRKGWNLTVLATKAGVSRTTLFQMERGAIFSPRATTLHRLAVALEIPIAQLNPQEQSPGDWQLEGSLPADVPPSVECDRQSNPYVDVLVQQFPEMFAGFTLADWGELYNSLENTTAINEEDLLQAATNIARKRETLRRLAVLLETHLAAAAAAMINGLFDLAHLPHATDSPVAAGAGMR